MNKNVLLLCLLMVLENGFSYPFPTSLKDSEKDKMEVSDITTVSDMQNIRSTLPSTLADATTKRSKLSKGDNGVPHKTVKGPITTKPLTVLIKPDIVERKPVFYKNPDENFKKVADAVTTVKKQNVKVYVSAEDEPKATEENIDKAIQLEKPIGAKSQTKIDNIKKYNDGHPSTLFMFDIDSDSTPVPEKKVKHNMSPVRFTPIFATTTTPTTTTTTTTTTPSPSSHPYHPIFKKIPVAVVPDPLKTVKINHVTSMTIAPKMETEDDEEPVKRTMEWNITKMLRKIAKQQSQLKTLVGRLSHRQWDMMDSINRIEDKLESEESSELGYSSWEEKENDKAFRSSFPLDMNIPFK